MNLKILGKIINRYREILVSLAAVVFLLNPMNCHAEELSVNGYVFWADSYEEAVSIGEEYGAELLEYDNGIGVVESTSDIENAEDVFYPNYEYEVEAYKWNPEANSQWHMEALKMQDAHKYSTGEGAKVAIIDSGIDVENEALNNNIIYAGSTIPDSFYGESGYEINYKGPQDYNGHGTHVAGLIGAHSENGTIVGIAPDCSLISIKAVEKKGNTATGYTSWIAQAVLKAVDLGADIINMSLGGSRKKDEFLTEAIEIAKESGVLVICAAGNHTGAGVQGTVDFPASESNTIAVSAVKQSGLDFELDYAYSKYGDGITVAAPGSKLISLGLDGTEKSLSGTSMACALVSGEVALIKSYSSEMSADEIRECMIDTCLDLGEKGWDNLYGHGVIQPFRALKSLDKDKKQPDKGGDKQHEQSSQDSEENGGTEVAELEEIVKETADSAAASEEENLNQEDVSRIEQERDNKQKTRREQLEESLNNMSPEDEILYSIQEEPEETEEEILIAESEKVDEALKEAEPDQNLNKGNLINPNKFAILIIIIMVGITGICFYFLIAKKKKKDEEES